MQIQDVPRNTETNPLKANMDKLIQGVGLAPFAFDLFAVVRQAAVCEHLAAFSYEGQGGARLVLAADAEKSCVAHEMGELFAARYWHADPVQIALQSHSEETGAFIMRLDRSDLKACTFRRQCYRSEETWGRVGSRMAERLSLVKRTEHGGFVVSMHRTNEQGPFEDQEVHNIAESCSELIALVARHGLAIHLNPIEAYKAHVKAVTMACPGLPRREAEIGAGIVIGLSSEAMALILAISENTVRTYRKRVYARLRISSQNELMRIVLPHLCSPGPCSNPPCGAGASQIPTESKS